MHLFAGVPASLQAYELVESNCNSRPILMRFMIVRTTLGMSSAYFASDCAIDAMIKAEYGVMCSFLAASANPVCRSWARYRETTSWRIFVGLAVGSMLYVAGYRKPSADFGTPSPFPV